MLSVRDDNWQTGEVEEEEEAVVLHGDEMHDDATTSASASAKIAAMTTR